MDPKPAKKVKGGAHPAVGGNGMAEIKELITQMESFIKEGDALAAMQIRRVEAMKETLKSLSSRLGAQLKEKDETIRKMESKRKEVEETLNAQIRDLERQVNERTAPVAAEPPESVAAEAEIPELDPLDTELDRAELTGEPPPQPPKERSPISLRELEGKLLGGPGSLKELIQDFKRGEAESKNKMEAPPLIGTVRPEKQIKRVGGQDPNKLSLSSLLGPIKKQS